MPRPADVAPASSWRDSAAPAAVYAARMAEFNYMFLRSILGTLVFLGALFAMNGIVANDRKQGFYPIPVRQAGDAVALLRAGVRRALGGYMA